MGYIKRKCDNCQNDYQADTRNLNRGWGLCCSKSCARETEEKRKDRLLKDRLLKEKAIKRNNKIDKILSDV